MSTNSELLQKLDEAKAHVWEVNMRQDERSWNDYVEVNNALVAAECYIDKAIRILKTTSP